MKPVTLVLTRSDLYELRLALQAQQDAAHDEWREAMPGKDRERARRYKVRLAKLQEKLDIG